MISYELRLAGEVSIKHNPAVIPISSTLRETCLFDTMVNISDCDEVISNDQVTATRVWPHVPLLVPAPLRLSLAAPSL